MMIRRLQIRSPHDSGNRVCRGRRVEHSAARGLTDGMVCPWDSATDEGGRMLGAGADGDQAPRLPANRSTARDTLR
jgi:hypothetical protein